MKELSTKPNHKLFHKATNQCSSKTHRHHGQWNRLSRVKVKVMKMKLLLQSESILYLGMFKMKKFTPHLAMTRLRRPRKWIAIIQALKIVVVKNMQQIKVLIWLSIYKILSSSKIDIKL